MTSGRALVRVLILAVLVPASLAVAPAATFAVTTPVFSITVGNCWSGQVPDENVDVHVVWKNSAGHVVDSFDTHAYEYGYWNFPASDHTCSTRPVRAGDRLTETETGKGKSRSYVVKAMGGHFDRKTNVVSGNAPIGSTLYVGVIQDDLIGYYGAAVCDGVTPNRAADGSFSYDTSACGTGYNAAGGDQAWVTWTSPHGDRQTLILTAPYAQVKFGTPKVSGYAFAGAPVSVTLKTAAGTTRATGSRTADVNGAWALNLKNTSGQLVKPHIGDVDSGTWATGTSTLTVFAMTTVFGTNTVRGTCPPNTRYSLIVLWPGTTYGSRVSGMTDGSGSTGDYTPDSHTLAAGDVVLFTCAKPNGDRERQVTVYQ